MKNGRKRLLHHTGDKHAVTLGGRVGARMIECSMGGVWEDDQGAKPTDRPRFHIVPSKVVADRTKKGHRTWLATPGKKGQQHRDTPMRNFLDPEDEFLERWELLGLG